MDLREPVLVEQLFDASVGSQGERWQGRNAVHALDKRLGEALPFTLSGSCTKFEVQSALVAVVKPRPAQQEDSAPFRPPSSRGLYEHPATRLETLAKLLKSVDAS